MSFNNIVANDYGQVLQLTIKDIDTLLAVNVSAFTTTKEIHLLPPSGGVKSKTADFTTDGSDGRIEYTRAQGDIDKPGDWKVRARVQSANAVLTSAWLPFTVQD